MNSDVREDIVLHFKFKKFFHEFYQNESTATKNELNYSNAIDFIKQARNVIFKNLSINQSFLKADGFRFDIIKNFYQVMVNSKNNIDQDSRAVILLLLHLSKCNLFDNTAWSLIFESIDSIIITESMDINFVPQLKSLYDSLVESVNFKKILSELIKDLTNQELVYNLQETKLTFFTCNLKGLNGFAGYNEIYVNLNELISLYLNLSEEKISVMKLDFTRLIIHEMAHVALRSTTKDFNISTCALIESSNNSVGIIAEKMLFKVRINWRESANICDLNYCNDFLENLLNNKSSSLNFETNKANVKLNEFIPLLSAVDYNLSQLPYFYFE